MKDLENSQNRNQRFSETAGADIDLSLNMHNVEMVTVSAEAVDRARRTWCFFDRGRDAAGLNFGDCFSCAFAKLSGEPLLFRGNVCS